MTAVIRGKRIVLGVGGSIAAYKALYLTRLFVERDAEVWPVLTRAATRFVTPLSFAALARRRPIVDLWSASTSGEISHVELAHVADALVLAPATADVLARLAEGRADDPLTAVALATRAPWLVAPAMEENMWTHPATVEHVRTLSARGARFVAPVIGELASGRTGVGRLAEPEQILEALLELLGPKDLTGERVLVTAGPTREAFDPARFVSNASSGKMGFALATAARRRGAEVELVSGPTSLPAPAGVHLTTVDTTEEMLAACERLVGSATVLVMAAAPSDYKPRERAARKTKKQPSATALTVELVRTPDVLAALAARTAGRIVVGFAAETHDVLGYARRKLEEKNLDLIVANDISEAGSGFGSDTNRVDLLDRAGTHTPLPQQSKEDVAEAIWDQVVRMRRSRSA